MRHGAPGGSGLGGGAPGGGGPGSGLGGGGDALSGRAGWIVAAAGLLALGAAAASAPTDTARAAGQDWPPFVLVSGLLFLGLVAGGDGLFAAAGSAVARLSRGGYSLLGASALLVAVVTAVLNLDTAVAFLTPVLVVAARRRRTDELPFLYLAVLLANGASLLLPGSNLTNLIVAGDRHLSGGSFAATMVAPWVASSLGVVVVLAIVYRRRLRRAGEPVPLEGRATYGVGLAGVVVAVAATVSLPAGAAAVVVLATGVVAVAVRVGGSRLSVADVGRTVHVRVLAGLFGLAVALGAVGRAWDGPSRLLAHATMWEAAGIGAAGAAVLNNLPAASLLAARPVPDPYALLIGLNLGPNLVVTGGLAALLWFQAARTVGARPSARRFSLLGAVVVPVSMAAALLALGAVR